MANPVLAIESKIAKLQRDRDVLNAVMPHLPVGLTQPSSVMVHKLFDSEVGLHYAAKTIWEAVEILEKFELVRCYVHRAPPFTSVRPCKAGDCYGVHTSMDSYRHELKAYVMLGDRLARVDVSLPKDTLGSYRKSDPRAKVRFKLLPECKLNGGQHVRFAAPNVEGEYSAPNIVTLWGSKESLHTELEKVYGARATTASH
ncbi:hypothetical protein [Cupriavidus sp. DL-D2]|uniref:hypothetical protein n=1 Tax=Cupriavidus sp. DL-D2 TaxID=3144974 RepID=UPI0032134249